MFDNIFKSKRRILGLEINDWWFVAVGLVIFAAIALWNITKSSIWFDEAFGAYLIHFNFIDIVRYTATDVHPPLFYWLLKLWSMFFGNSELALRSMSVFFGGIAIVFGYLLSNRLFNKKVARISLIFIVLSPMFIRYSQEARMYTLVAAVALAATYVLTFAITTKKRLPWIIYGILVGLGMWVHYFATVIWIAHWIWRGDIIRRVVKREEFIKTFFSKEWKLAHIIAIGIFFPWLPLMINQLFIIQAYGFWIPPVTADTIVNYATNVVYYLDVTDATGWLALCLLSAAVFLAILAFRIYKAQDEAERQSYRLVITLAFVPMLILFVLSMPPVRSVFVDRYLITSAVGIGLFIGTTLAPGYNYLYPKLRVLSTVIIALLMTIGIYNVYQLGNYNKNTHSSNGTRQIIDKIVVKSKEGQPIIAAKPWLFYETSFYSTKSHPSYFIEPSEYKFGSLDMLKYNDAHKIKDISAFSKQNPIIWYVTYSGSSDFSSPDPSWKAIQDITVDDSVSGKPVYKAVQYKISN